MRRAPAARRVGPPPDSAALRIERIGLDGDGIAHLPDGTRFYAPFVLPGEIALLHPLAKRGEGWAARVEDLQTPSPSRVAPACTLFGTCGGCTLQHWQTDDYAAWKHDILRQALSRAGVPLQDLDTRLAPLQRIAAGSRRRIDLAVQRMGHGPRAEILIGLHERRGHDIVDMTTCPVLDPRLNTLISALRPLLAQISALKKSGSAVVNVLDNGPDLLLRTDAPLSAEDRQILAQFAKTHGLPRIAWAQETDTPENAAQWYPPLLRFGDAEVEPPPGAFLQATPASEAAIVKAVVAGLPSRLTNKSKIIELYAGCGTLTFPLAEHAHVLAYEGDAAAYGALRKAAGGRRITPHQRDLMRQPLMARELSTAAAIVLDPPWAGAQAQIEQIAASTATRVVYVSCNPTALADDAKRLLQAGFTLEQATPIDQFLWSSRLESVVVFSRRAISTRNR